MSKTFTLRGRKLPFSFLLEKRALTVTAVLALVTFLVFLFSVGYGEMKIHPWNVLLALIGMGEPRDAVIINNLRLPRILIALLVGASLAVSGAILQGIIRNPLASPDIIGITGGASVAAVVFITYFSEYSVHLLPVAAFLGAAVVMLLIYFLSWKNGVTALRLVLIGIGFDAVAKALTTLLTVISPVYLTAKAVTWLTGSVYGSSWANVFTLLPWVAILLPLAFILGRSVNVQQLGDDIATGVGSTVQKDRFLLLLICVGLAGAGVAMGGAIGFVGLLAPHIARKLVGPSFGGLLFATALVGSLTVMIADLIARTAFSPLDLPVGIFTAGVGAPFFLYLLYKNRNR